MAKKRKIRIAFLMTPTGEWDSAGWGGVEGDEDDDYLRNRLEQGALGGVAGSRFAWVEFYVEPPAPPPAETVIRGRVAEEVGHG